MSDTFPKADEGEIWEAVGFVGRTVECGSAGWGPRLKEGGVGRLLKLLPLVDNFRELKEGPL